MDERKLLILGAGGHGKMVASIAQSMNRWSEICFVDDRYPELTSVLDCSVVADFASLPNLTSDFSEVALGLGDNDLRLLMLKKAQKLGFALPTLIAPSAIIHHSARVAEGVVVMPNAVINAEVRVGMASIINTASVIEHDCRLGAGVHVSPTAALAGGVQVGDGAWIGLGAKVIGGITIGKNSIVGAGSVVINDVPNEVTVVGVPGKIIKHFTLENIK